MNAPREIRGIREKARREGRYGVYGVYRVGRGDEETGVRAARLQEALTALEGRVDVVGTSGFETREDIRNLQGKEPGG